MATPDTKHSLVVFKQFTYRGASRTWGNRYHFEGALPADHTAWETLADAVVAAEKAIYADSIEIVQAAGYDAGTATSTNPHGDAVFTKSYSVAGTADWGLTGHPAPSDCAALLRWSTTARSTKNHPVYLMNYFHGAYAPEDAKDTLLPVQKTAIDVYGGAWQSGFSDGSITRERCGPRGAVAVGHRTDPYIRHRDFPN